MRQVVGEAKMGSAVDVVVVFHFVSKLRR